jgi:hypothetical protein
VPVFIDRARHCTILYDFTARAFQQPPDAAPGLPTKLAPNEIQLRLRAIRSQFVPVLD